LQGGGTGLLLVPLLLALSRITAARVPARERLFYGLLWTEGLLTLAVDPQSPILAARDDADGTGRAHANP
jgi:hypothetical protein